MIKWFGKNSGLTEVETRTAATFIVLGVLVAFGTLNTCLWVTTCGAVDSRTGIMTYVSPISQLIPWKVYP